MLGGIASLSPALNGFSINVSIHVTETKTVHEIPPVQESIMGRLLVSNNDATPVQNVLSCPVRISTSSR